jgi:hypothetical protein
MLIIVNGVTITIVGPWDAMCQIYTMSVQEEEDAPKKEEKEEKVK